MKAASCRKGTRVVSRDVCKDKRACKVSGEGRDPDRGQAGTRLVKIGEHWGEKKATEGKGGRKGWSGRRRGGE